MKKYFIFIFICLALTSCNKKEEINIQPDTQNEIEIVNNQNSVNDNSDIYNEGILTVKVDFAGDVTQTKYTLFDFDKDKYEYNTVKTFGETGQIDESDFTVVNADNFLIDNAFAIFEKNGINYYALELDSESLVDSSEEYIIVKEENFNKIIENWDINHTDISSNVYNVWFDGRIYDRIEADSPVEAAKTIVKDAFKQNEFTDIYEYTTWLVNKYHIDVEKLGPDGITIKVMPCNEEDATIRVQKCIKDNSKDDCSIFYYKEKAQY